jgi:hypothetical protein
VLEDGALEMLVDGDSTPVVEDLVVLKDESFVMLLEVDLRLEDNGLVVVGGMFLELVLGVAFMLVEDFFMFVECKVVPDGVFIVLDSILLVVNDTFLLSVEILLVLVELLRMLVEGFMGLVNPFLVLVRVLLVFVKPFVALFDVFLADVEAFLEVAKDFVIVVVILPSTQRQSLIRSLVAYFRKGEELRGLDRRN